MARLNSNQEVTKTIKVPFVLRKITNVIPETFNPYKDVTYPNIEELMTPILEEALHHCLNVEGTAAYIFAMQNYRKYFNVVKINLIYRYSKESYEYGVPVELTYEIVSRKYKYWSALRQYEYYCWAPSKARALFLLRNKVKGSQGTFDSNMSINDIKEVIC